MARNNEERTGAKSAATPPLPPMVDPTTTDQAFSFVTPTEFVELPSGGRYYPEGHPLHNQSSLEIRYMTAKDEDILTSRALLKKGVALDRLLKNVIVDKRVKPNDLLVGDKNAVLVATRISGYGEDYNTQLTCPMCLSTTAHDIDLSGLKLTDGLEAMEEHEVRHEAGRFFITLPKMKVEVGLKMTTGADEAAMMRSAERKKKMNLPEATLTDQFKAIIESVNSSEDLGHINELINCMPASDSKYLRSVYTKITPNVDMTSEFQCPVCDHEEEVSVPFTAEFFWPK
tara:strand:+ start:1087 stop:1944 length:858 start_codon:yes stop_codon:yes gene_type:complete